MHTHAWKNAPNGLFHHFHQQWSAAICNSLNAGLLPKGFYALIEQHAGLAIRNKLGELVSVIEIVSPGNKHSQIAVRKFVEKASELLRMGIHLLVVDPFPPGRRDPQGLHQLLWRELEEEDFRLPRGKPLTLVSYCCGYPMTAFVEPIAIGAKLPEMPLFVDPDVYVPVPLGETYAATWKLCPEEFREVILETTK
jgi:hypothetical protein